MPPQAEEALGSGEDWRAERERQLQEQASVCVGLAEAVWEGVCGGEGGLDKMWGGGAVMESALGGEGCWHVQGWG